MRTNPRRGDLRPVATFFLEDLPPIVLSATGQAARVCTVSMCVDDMLYCSSYPDHAAHLIRIRPARRGQAQKTSAAGTGGVPAGRAALRRAAPLHAAHIP